MILLPVWLSLKIALLATLATLLTGLPVAWLLGRRSFPGRGLLETVVLVPLVMPPTVLGYYLLVLFGRSTPLGEWLGQVGITTTDLSLDKVSGTRTGDSEKNGNARSSEGSFNNQLFFTNTNILVSPASLDQQSTADEFRLNGNATFASDRHTVEAKPDAGLTDKSPGIFSGIENEGAPVEAHIIIDGSTIGDRPIGITDFNVSTDLPAPSGESTITELQVLNLQKVSLVPFMQLPTALGHRDQFVGSSTLLYTAPGLSQGERKNNQNVLQHNLSFGTLTLPPDRNLVNSIGGSDRLSVMSDQVSASSLDDASRITHHLGCPLANSRCSTRPPLL